MSENNEIDAPCKCTMSQVSHDKWEKPKDGHIEPDPNCSHCCGKGKIKLKIEMGGDGCEVFVGVCSLCGHENGVYFVYPDMDAETEAKERELIKPGCKNDDCPNEFCSWVNVKDLDNQN